MTRSIMLRPSMLLDLFPCASRSRMREETLLASPQLVALPIGNGQLRVFLRDAVPEVFDKLDSFGSCEREERCEFGVHVSNVATFSGLFSKECAETPNENKMSYCRSADLRTNPLLLCKIQELTPIRFNKKLDHFTYRGLKKISVQWRLYCLVHNIEKIARFGKKYGPKQPLPPLCALVSTLPPPIKSLPHLSNAFWKKNLPRPYFHNLFPNPTPADSKSTYSTASLGDGGCMITVLGYEMG